MDAATQCYIAERIPNPMYGYPRWVTSAVVAGVDGVDIDFGNTFQGVFISKLIPAPLGGITGNITNANGQVLINIPIGSNTQIDFDYFIESRHLIIRSDVLGLQFSLRFQNIYTGKNC